MIHAWWAAWISKSQIASPAKSAKHLSMGHVRDNSPLPRSREVAARHPQYRNFTTGQESSPSIYSLTNQRGRYGVAPWRPHPLGGLTKPRGAKSGRKGIVVTLASGPCCEHNGQPRDYWRTGTQICPLRMAEKCAPPDVT